MERSCPFEFFATQHYIYTGLALATRASAPCVQMRVKKHLLSYVSSASVRGASWDVRMVDQWPRTSVGHSLTLPPFRVKIVLTVALPYTQADIVSVPCVNTAGDPQYVRDGKVVRERSFHKSRR